MSGEVEASQDDLDLRALEDFWVGNEDLDRLEAFLRFNIFEVIGMAHQELRHSRLLAYLLDPRKDHGLGDLLVKRLLQRVLSTANSGQAETMVPVSPAELESWDLTRATVNREWHHVDILIRDQEHRLVVIIENKIRSGERPGQLRRYLDAAHRHYPGWRVVPLFLTPDGTPPSEETYLAVDYGLVCEVLDAVVKTRAEGVNPDVKTLMAHYTGMMRRRFLGDKRITELVRRIHQRHGRAIDLINRYRPDTQTDLVAELEALVDEEPNLVAVYSAKNRISFSVDGWDVPTLRTEDWPVSGRILLFEFFNKPRDLQLKLMVGPGNAWLNAGSFPERERPKRKKPGPVAPYAAYLDRRWGERCINMAQLFREIKELGYEGSYDAVADHLRCLRKGLVPPARAPTNAGGERTKGTRHESQEIARLLMLEAKDPEALDLEQARYLEGLRSSTPELALVQNLAGWFAGLVREGEEGGLTSWLREAGESELSEIRTFARGIRQDEAAVRAAIREPWSNGQVEGHVNRLKMLKRQMYGRAKFDLLRRRVLGAA